MMRRLALLLVSQILLCGLVLAQPLDTPFFSTELPEGWTVSRTSGGLWSISGPEESEVFTLLPVRLTTTPEVYLQATAKLWRLRGDVETLGETDHSALFLLKPKDTPQEWQLKVARWQDHSLLMTTSMFPVKHYEVAREATVGFTGNLQVKSPEYSRAALEQVIRRGLKAHRDDRAELSELDAVRAEMAGFRVDWEPYFPHSKPRLYTSYLAYLESRFDASFALTNREKLGMPETLIAERLEAVRNRAREAVKALESPDSDVDGL